ncbi:MAG: hypothetical protein ACE5OR_11330 [bacterium]
MNEYNRMAASVKTSAKKKGERIRELDQANIGEPLLLKAPSPDLLYTLDELGLLLEDLIGIGAPRDENARLLDVRPKGMWFEWEAAQRLASLIIQTGEQLAKLFDVPITQTIKYQMGIPVAWRHRNVGNVIVGGKILSRRI